MLKVHGLACAAVLLGTSAVFGQAVVQETQVATAPASAPQIRRMSHIIGSTVRLQGNNNFGKVDDVVLNQNGQIAYLVVANGNRYAMMPWTPANFNWNQRYVTYNVTPQAVQPLFFTQNAWPNITDQQFTTRMQQVFPNVAPVRREVLRPVEGTVPVVPGAPPAVVAPAPPGGVVQEKIKEKPNGTIKVKEKVR